LREVEQKIQEAVADTVEKTSQDVPSAEQETSEHFLEEYYNNDAKNFELKIGEQAIEIETLQQRLHESENETRKLQNQLRDASNREKLWEKTINEKEIEIEMMREKLSVGAQQQQQEIFEMNGNSVATREIEQLQETLEERDRHIQDLTDTLSHFHVNDFKFDTHA
jgi:centrosomal protein CEP290